MSIFHKKDEETTNTLGNNFHLLKYLAFNIYKIIQWTGLTDRWKNMNELIEYQIEIKKQLDVKMLLKRLINIEHLVTYMF